MVNTIIAVLVAAFLTSLGLTVSVKAHPEPPMCYEVGSVFLDREEFQGVWWMARPAGADKTAVYITLPKGRR